MPRTTWELDLKANGRAGARALARDLRELDASLRALRESAPVLRQVADSAAALRGARVRVRAERMVGDETARQQRRSRQEFDANGRVRRAVERSQAREAKAASRAEAADQSERRRIGEGIARARERADREDARAAQATARRNAQAFRRDQRDATARERRDQRAARGAARLNAQAFRRDEADRRRTQRAQERASLRAARLNAQAFRRDQAMMDRQRRQRERAASRAQERSQRDRGAMLGSLGGGLMAGLQWGAGGALAFSAATTAALSTILDMVTAATSLATRLGLATLEMIGFREASLATLRGMARDDRGQRLTGAAASRQASEQYRWAAQFARETPLDAGQVIDLQRQTSAAGFFGGRNRDVVQAAADVGAFNLNDPTASNRFLLGLQQLNNASTVRIQDLRQTAQAASLNENDLLRSIAAQQGATKRAGESDAAYNARVQRMQREGQLRGGDNAVQAILAAIRERNGGELGTEARRSGGTLMGTLSNLRGLPLDFIATSIENIENLPGIRALKTFLNDFVAAFTGTGKTAQRLQQLFAGIVNEASAFVASFGGKDGAEGLISRAVDLFEEWAPLVRDVVGAFSTSAFAGFREGLEPLLELVRGMGQDGPGVVAMARTIGREFGRLLAFGVRLTARLGEFVAMMVTGLPDLIAWLEHAAEVAARVDDAIPAPFRSLLQEFLGIGGDVPAGFLNGFRPGAAAALAEVRQWSSDIAVASKEQLKIHSPSRVFRDEIGAMIPWGMAAGIEGGTADVQRAMGDMVAPPALNFGAAAGGLPGLGGAGGLQATFHVYVQGGATPAGAREFAEQAWGHMGDLAERDALMGGP